MKRFFFMLFVCVAAISCQDHNLESDEITDREQQEMINTKNISRLVFTSANELQSVIERMKKGVPLSTIATRATDPLQEDVVEPTNSQNFQSLAEAYKEKCFASLTEAQLDTIRNDEEGLEFCLADSIIADSLFAELVNADREIQVGNIVYKYVSNGVAYADSKDATALKSIEEEVKNIAPPMNEEEPREIQLNTKVKFIPYPYGQVTLGEKEGSALITRSVSDEPLILENGVVIPASDIRDVNYKDKGDGNWFHRTWTNIWGRNVVALNKFRKRRQLNLNLYDQNYIIYANIGTKVKLQKKVCGIWWNIKAQEIRQGWTAVEMKYTFPTPVMEKMPDNPVTTPKPYKPEYPEWLKHKFPFKNEEVLLLHIPIASYDLKTKDINSFFRSSVKTATKQAIALLKDWANQTNNTQLGIFTIDDRNLYIMVAGDEAMAYKRRSLEKKFYSKWFPGSYEFGFSYGGKIKFTGIKFDGSTHTQLHRAIVYGAIKYGNRWIGARITKDE